MTTQRGFTLVELVIVIIVLAILAVSVIPRLTSISGYEQIAQRDESIGLLRNVQQRAMQNTQTSYPTCHRVLFFATELGLAAQQIGGECDTGLASSSGAIDDFNLVNGLESYSALNANGDAITFLDFDSMGVPSVNTGSCAPGGCRINFGADAVCIESEGYIRVCP